MALGDDLDGAVDRFDGGLIVNRVRRHRHHGGPSFCVGQGILRGPLVIQVRKKRKINEPQRSVVAGGQVIVLRNEKGAVLRLSGQQIGLQINADLSGLSVSVR